MKRLPALLAAALLSLPVLAHDFWMRPGNYRPAKDALIEVGLYVGDLGIGEAVPRSEERIVQFAAMTPDGEKKLLGRDGLAPAGYLRTSSDGFYVLGFQSSPAFVTLPPTTFVSYLEERGLDAVRQLRATRGESDQPARELYSLSSKAILKVGEQAASGFERALGLALELTPGKDPYVLPWNGPEGPFERLPLQLTFRGVPLAGALVRAINLDDPPREERDAQRVLQARSDAEGRVWLSLPSEGRWMVAAVHMLSLEDRSQADFESFWASLTFEVRRKP